MRRFSSLVGLCALLWGCVNIAHAQDAVVVSIRTNAPDAVVYADSVRLGPAAKGPYLISPATQALRLQAWGPATWSVPPIVEPLAAAAGDTLSLRMFFPYHYLVESVPFGASVYLEGAGARWRLGTTPLRYQTDAPLSGTLVVERGGYVAARIEPGTAVWNRHVTHLTSVEQVTARSAEVDWTPPAKRRRWVDYAAIGTAIAAGVLTIHYKFKADGLYDDYERDPSAELQDRINAYDRRAGVALGVMQAGVGVFAVRLALR